MTSISRINTLGSLQFSFRQLRWLSFLKILLFISVGVLRVFSSLLGSTSNLSLPYLYHLSQCAHLVCLYHCIPMYPYAMLVSQCARLVVSHALLHILYHCITICPACISRDFYCVVILPPQCVLHYKKTAQYLGCLTLPLKCSIN